MKYLITGGAGFIGSFMAERLLSLSNDVIVVDNLFRGSLQNIKHLKKYQNFSFYRLDIIEDIVKVSQLIRKELPDVILHYAAINGTKYFYEIPHDVVRVNGCITDALCRSIEPSLGTDYRPSIVLASTSEVYGEPHNIPTNENDLTYLRISESRDSYAAGKLFSEFIVKHFAEKNSMNWMIFRIFNVYGPRMINTSYGQVVPELIYRTLNGEYPLKLIGDGEQKRSFIYIEDHVELSLMALKKANWNNVYNLGNPNEISIKDLASKIMILSGVSPSFIFSESRSGDHLRRCPDISKLFKFISEFEFISLDDGLIKVINSKK